MPDAQPVQGDRMAAAQKMVTCYDPVRSQDGTRPVLGDAALARHAGTNVATIREARRRVKEGGTA